MATVSSAGWTGDVGVTDFEVDGKLGVTDLLSSLLSSLSLSFALLEALSSSVKQSAFLE